jgi:hypothetical protein
LSLEQASVEPRVDIAWFERVHSMPKDGASQEALILQRCETLAADLEPMLTLERIVKEYEDYALARRYELVEASRALWLRANATFQQWRRHESEHADLLDNALSSTQERMESTQPTAGMSAQQAEQIKCTLAQLDEGLAILDRKGQESLSRLKRAENEGVTLRILRAHTNRLEKAAIRFLAPRVWASSMVFALHLLLLIVLAVVALVADHLAPQIKMTLQDKVPAAPPEGAVLLLFVFQIRLVDPFFGRIRRYIEQAAARRSVRLVRRSVEEFEDMQGLLTDTASELERLERALALRC